MSATVLGIEIPNFASQVAASSWEQLLDTLDALSPLLCDERPGRALAQMRGVSGTAEVWLARARALLEPSGLPAQFAVAPNPFTARLAAQIADGSVWEEARLAGHLKPLPLHVLEIDLPTCERLHAFGLQTCGDLAALPHGPFVRRFGARAARWHERACGIDETPLRPRARRLEIDVGIQGEGGIQNREQLAFALRQVLEKIAADCRGVGMRAGSLELHFECENGETQELSVALATPSAEARVLFDIAYSHLETQYFRSPILALRIRAERFEEGGEALSLLVRDAYDAQSVSAILGRIQSRLGTPVRAAHLRDAHPLEERFFYQPFAFPRAASEGAPAALAAELVPQLQFLAVREIAVSVRNALPFTVDQPPRRVLDVAGPWRIEEGWFEREIARDEYDVLLENGRLYRIFHQGERWYLHGIYD